MRNPLQRSLRAVRTSVSSASPACVERSASTPSRRARALAPSPEGMARLASGLSETHGSERAEQGASEQEEPATSGVHTIAESVGDAMDIDVSAAVEQVTLVVYGWKSVEPGTLWWAFPSLAAALSAARAMTNAVRWAIVAGSRKEVDVEEERRTGTILMEA